MLGAITGDIIGSVYEGKVGWQSARTPHFKPLFHPLARFTDDTVLTIAVAESILRGGDLVDLLFEHAIRLAVSLGGDSDTIACIAGGIAQAYYGEIPAVIRDQSLARLDDRLREIVEEFELRFPRLPRA